MRPRMKNHPGPVVLLSDLHACLWLSSLSLGRVPIVPGPSRGCSFSLGQRAKQKQTPFAPCPLSHLSSSSS